MSCKATRPFISRADAALIRPDWTDPNAGVFVQDPPSMGFNNTVENTFAQLGVSRDLITQIAVETTRIVEFTDLSKLPGLQLRVNEGSGYFNPFDLADMINVTGYDPGELLSELRGQFASPVSNDTFIYLQQLDFYYNEFLSATSQKSKCDPLYKMWQLIVQIELLVKTAQNWIARLRKWKEELIGFILNFEEIVKEFLEEIAERIRQRIRQLVAKILAKLEMCVEQTERIGQWVTAQLDKLEKFFSKENIQKIGEDVAQSLKDITKPLESFEPSNIAYMLWRLCSFIESIINLFKNPLLFFQNALAFLCSSQILIEESDRAASERAVGAGGQRVDANNRDRIRRQITEGMNTPRVVTQTNSSGESTATDFGPDLRNTRLSGDLTSESVVLANGDTFQTPDIETTSDTTGNTKILRPYPMLPYTSAEFAWAANIQPRNDYFSFEPQVISMSRTARNHFNSNWRDTPVAARPDLVNRALNQAQGWNDDTAGYSMVHKQVLIALRRIAIAMGQQFGRSYYFTVNSAYRNTYYNAIVKGLPSGLTSQHSTGKALDVGNLSLSPEEQTAFIYHAVSNNCLGIGLYRSFTHIDTRRYPWYSASRTRQHGITGKQEVVNRAVQRWEDHGHFVIPSNWNTITKPFGSSPSAPNSGPF